MRSERLVRLIGYTGAELVDSYHDKIRESVLESLGDARRLELHARFGLQIEQSEGVTADAIREYLTSDITSIRPIGFSLERIYDLAYHFHAAGDSRGFAYQFMAGELSFQAYASEEALSFSTRTGKFPIGNR